MRETQAKNSFSRVLLGLIVAMAIVGCAYGGQRNSPAPFELVPHVILVPKDVKITYKEIVQAYGVTVGDKISEWEAVEAFHVVSLLERRESILSISREDPQHLDVKTGSFSKGFFPFSSPSGSGHVYVIRRQGGGWVLDRILRWIS